LSHNRAKPLGNGVVMEKDETLDSRGLMCPMPIVKLAKKMKEMQVGKDPAHRERTGGNEAGRKGLLLLYQEETGLRSENRLKSIGAKKKVFMLKK
jgi:hypothetical protein